jgi:hypothetical protein
MNPHAVRIAVLLILGLMPTSAFAQTPTEVAAAEVFRRATTAMSARDFAEAARLFGESYRLAPATNSLYNLAYCHRALGHARLAVEFFERFLLDAGAEVAPARETAIRLAIVDLRANLAALHIAATPATTTISVDGVSATVRGDELLLDPGRHTLTFAAPSHAPEERVLTARAGEVNTMSVSLRPVESVTLGASGPVAGDASRLASAVAPTATHDTVGTSRSIVTRWWFWTGVAVVVAGGITAAVLASSGSAELSPADVRIETILAR